MAIACAAAASLIIVVNALFLQSGAHPAPFFANPADPPPSPPADIRAAAPAAPVQKPPEVVAARPVAGSRTPQTASARRNDPIADLIGPAPSSAASRSRVMAVQRLLSDYGYGQIKPSGVVDEPTSAAIAKFEGERKLPVTGRLSDRLLSELAAMTGHPVD
jgi:peptidoglycan hydrolase-like protein with peptidoglycan-binding domain